MRTFTYAERPDLAARTGEIEDTMAAFMGHGEVALRHWHKLRPELPELQLVLWDDEHDVVVGHARTLPARASDGLPGGIDDMLETWFGERRATRARRPLGDGRGRRPATAGGGVVRRPDRGDARSRSPARVPGAHRARPPDVEGALPADPDGPVRVLETRRRPAVRPLASRARAPRRGAARGLSGVDADRGKRRRLGGVDGALLSRRRGLRRARRRSCRFASRAATACTSSRTCGCATGSRDPEAATRAATLTRLW